MITTIMNEICADNDEYQFSQKDLEDIQTFIKDAKDEIETQGLYHPRVFRAAIDCCLIDFIDNNKQYIADMETHYILTYYCKLYFGEFKKDANEEEKEKAQNILSKYKRYVNVEDVFE